MKQTLTLAKLNPDQIQKAKETHGPRTKITHILHCGVYSRMFGTEKHCRKYYSAWSEIFPNIFNRYFETNHVDIENYESTPELVIKLIEANDSQAV